MDPVENVDNGKSKHRFCAVCIVNHNGEHYGNKGMLIFYEHIELNDT